MLADDEIRDIVQNASSAEFACNELVDRANQRGGEDNTTVIVFKN